MIPNYRQLLNVLRFQHRTSAAPLHCQIHHQPKSVPVHNQSTCAIISTRIIFWRFRPVRTTNPEPPPRCKRLQLDLHFMNQISLAWGQSTQITQTFQGSRANLSPTFTQSINFTAIGAEKHWVCSRGTIGKHSDWLRALEFLHHKGNVHI